MMRKPTRTHLAPLAFAALLLSVATPTGPGPRAASDAETSALTSEIQGLREDLETIKRDVLEIKQILQRVTRSRPKRATAATVTVTGQVTLGSTNAPLRCSCRRSSGADCCSAGSYGR